MPEPSTQSKKLQWKWVGITILLYALFYLLPLMFLIRTSNVLSGAWMFAGLVIVAAVAGFLSKGVTIWEPAIAGAVLVFLFFLGLVVFIPPKARLVEAILSMIFTLVCVFLLSLFGAWFGERAQKLWKKEPPTSTLNP